LTEKIETTTKAIKEIPTLKAITLPQQVFPAIETAPDQQVYPAPLLVTELAREAPRAISRDTSQPAAKHGKIATAYFKRLTTKTKDADTTFGINDRGEKFYIADTKI
jgi:hypothetical protein